MGYIKFKLTNILPNAWFFKLKDMNKTSKTLKKPYLPPQAPPLETPSRLEPQTPSRKSYHIARELTIESPPSKSSKSRKSSRRSSSISTSTCSCHSSSTLLTETDVVKTLNNVGFLVEDALLTANNKQSILDNALADNNKPEQFINNNFQLPPIITKPIITTTQEKLKSPSRRLTIVSPGRVKLKMNSPRIVGRKQGQNGNKKIINSKKRRSISESFAVVKSSCNPQRDFRESMVEMILQNNLTAAKDLEDLLACYLSLNSDEYHDVIIKVFKQIWIDLRQHK